MFAFHMPVNIQQGRGILKKKGKELLPAIGKKCFVVTGRHSAKVSGALDDLTEVLNTIGMGYTIFDAVEENPSFATVEEAAEKMKREHCDFVFAIGGGSPVDAGKAIAALAKNNGWSAEDLYSVKNPEALPVVCIPTTSGTGTEVTQYAILTDRFGNKGGFGSESIFPVYSFMDPEYTMTMPETITISTGVDALSHSIEGELKNGGNDPLVSMLSGKANAMIKENLKATLRRPKDYKTREQLQLASMYAGIVISQYGTTIVHSAGYPLSSFKDVKHGIANAYFLVPVLRRVAQTNEPIVSNAIKPFKSLDELDRFLEDFGVYDNRPAITRKERQEWAKQVRQSQRRKKTPGNFDLAFFEDLYQKITSSQSRPSTPG